MSLRERKRLWESTSEHDRQPIAGLGLGPVSHREIKNGYEALETSIRNVHCQLDSIEEHFRLPSFCKELPWLSWAAIALLSLFFAVLLRLGATYSSDTSYKKMIL